MAKMWGRDRESLPTREDVYSATPSVAPTQMTVAEMTAEIDKATRALRETLDQAQEMLLEKESRLRAELTEVTEAIKSMRTTRKETAAVTPSPSPSMSPSKAKKRRRQSGLPQAVIHQDSSKAYVTQEARQLVYDAIMAAGRPMKNTELHRKIGWSDTTTGRITRLLFEAGELTAASGRGLPTDPYYWDVPAGVRMSKTVVDPWASPVVA